MDTHGPMHEPRPPKPQSIGIDPTLHSYVSLLANLLTADLGRNVKIKEVVEGGLWDLVKTNRERLAAALGRPIEIPASQQLELAAA